MHAIFKIIIFLGTAFCLSEITLHKAFAQMPVASIAAFDYPPYIAANEPKGGLVGEIVLDSFALEGQMVELEFLPTNRFVATAFNGPKSACFISTSKNIKRLSTKDQQQVISSPPLAQITMVLVAYQSNKKPTPKFNAIEDLAGSSVIAIRGSNYTTSLLAAGAAVQEAPIESQLRMLKFGRADFALMGDLVARQIIQKFSPADSENFILLPKQVDTLNLIFACNRNHPEGQALFDRFKIGFQNLYKSGRYRKLLNAYYGDNLSQEYEKNMSVLAAPWSPSPP